MTRRNYGFEYIYIYLSSFFAYINLYIQILYEKILLCDQNQNKE